MYPEGSLDLLRVARDDEYERARHNDLIGLIRRLELIRCLGDELLQSIGVSALDRFRFSDLDNPSSAQHVIEALGIVVAELQVRHSISEPLIAAQSLETGRLSYALRAAQDDDVLIHASRLKRAASQAGQEPRRQVDEIEVVPV